LLLVLLLSACAPAPTPAIAVPPNPPTALPPSPIPPTPTPAAAITPTQALPDPAQLKSGSYVLSAANGLKVTLVDGKFEFNDTAKHVTARGQLLEPVAYGDVDGDGRADTVLIIAVNNGGSGTFHELIVLLAGKGQAASRVMGDRISEKKLTIQNGSISLEYIRSGPKDPLCCPTEHALTTLQYKNNDLVVLSDQVLAQ
jgi:hypothetical protein